MPVIQAFQGKSPVIHSTAFIAENAVLVGDVTVGPHASIWYGCVLRADVAPIVIGEASNIQDGTVIHTASRQLKGEARGTFVGKHCTVGHMALLHACTLEDYAFVGMQSCVSDDAVLESFAMCGAGSLIPPGKRLLSNRLYLGRPAIEKRPLSNEERDFIRSTALHYTDLAAALKLECEARGSELNSSSSPSSLSSTDSHP